IPQLAALLRSGQLTSVELTELYLDRLERFDTLEAVITLTTEMALEHAERADEELAAGTDRGPLHGIPYGVKDLMAVPNYPTTWGAMPYKDQQIGYTASVVEQLEAAGAVLVAKLTSGALARGDVWFGGATKNPWDLEQGASGSSAGSGSATAAGLVAFAIGTETLGSIVSPSTRCGVTGLRPTYGRVSRYGTMSLSWSMDKIGPIARSAEDCAIVFDAIRGEDLRDPTLLEAPFAYEGKLDWSSLKIGYLKDQFENDSSDNSVNNDTTLVVLEGLGAELVAIQTPEGVPYDVFDIILRAEAGAFFDELVRSHGDRDMVQQNKRSRANSLRQSRFIPAVEYLQANRHRRVLIEKMDDIFEEVDVLVSPTFGGRQLVITNLTGHPAISVPNGFDEDGHPTSFTIVGQLFDEATILGLAESYQAATSYHQERPRLFLE
ncbi:MAG: amidase, partial [Bacteroidota bacterium]